MENGTSSREKLYSSTHRAILGVLLTIACSMGIGLVGNGIYISNIIYIIAGLVIVVTSAYWIGHLFFEGLRER